MTRSARLVLALAVCACTTSPRPNPLPPPAARTLPATPEPTPLPPLTARAEPELDALLARRGVSGAIAVLEGDSPVAACNDLARCQEELTPASTFKIPNSIIGLETGVIPDAEFLIPWDGKKRPVAAWNRDHTLRTAFRESAVWYYQQLARRVGPERMRDWLARLEYGNQQIGERIDQFWLETPLAITPLQQLEFLRKLVQSRLPIAPHTRAILFDISRRGELDGKPLHGKTGWADPGGPNEIGWFVGWLDDPGNPRYVAVAVVRPPKGADLLPMRQAIAEDALRVRPK